MEFMYGGGLGFRSIVEKEKERKHIKSSYVAVVLRIKLICLKYAKEKVAI